jgi:hypothetical protein
VLLLDAPTPNRWPSLLAWPTRWSAGSTGGRGRRPTRAARSSAPWPEPGATIEGRPSQRPSRFADAGLTLLRTSGRTRSGAGATAARTDTSASPRTRTPTPCRWRCVTGRRHPGRSGHLLLPRRARVAVIFPVDDRAQHRRARRAEPVQRTVVRSCGCVTRTAREIEVIDDGDIARWTAEHDGYASLDPPATCIAARCCWTGRRAASTSSMRSTAAATTSGWPSISGLRSRCELEGFLRGPAAGPHAAPGAARLELPGTAVEPAPRRDRPHPRLVLPRPGSPRSRLHAPGSRSVRARDAPDHSARVPGCRPVGQICRSQQAVSWSHPPSCRTRLNAGTSPRSERRPDEPAGTGPARSVQIVRRHKLLVGLVVLVGLLAGGAATPCSSRRCSPVPRWSRSSRRSAHWPRSRPTGAGPIPFHRHPGGGGRVAIRCSRRAARCPSRHVAQRASPATFRSEARPLTSFRSPRKPRTAADAEATATALAQ